MSYFSRRKFMLTAGISASAILLKGCLGNPPEPGGDNTTRTHFLLLLQPM